MISMRVHVCKCRQHAIQIFHTMRTVEHSVEQYKPPKFNEASFSCTMAVRVYIGSYPILLLAWWGPQSRREYMCIVVKTLSNSISIYVWYKHVSFPLLSTVPCAESISNFAYVCTRFLRVSLEYNICICMACGIQSVKVCETIAFLLLLLLLLLVLLLLLLLLLLPLLVLLFLYEWLFCFGKCSSFV